MKIISDIQWDELCDLPQNSARALERCHTYDLYKMISYREHFVIISLGSNHQEFWVQQYLEQLEKYIKKLMEKKRAAKSTRDNPY